MRQLLVLDLGRCGYAEALAFQRALAAARLDRRVADDVLLLVEHPPVITLGRSANAGNLLATEAMLRARGVERFEVERGGDITFHGPGQLVGYPIVDLTDHRQDLHWYLRQVEEVMIRGVAPFGIVAERVAGKTGVWTRGRKLASIGVHARQWVTWHGFALNVTTDLSFFDLMVPCGIPDVIMTSVEQELRDASIALGGAAASGSDRTGSSSPTLAAEVRTAVVGAFGEVFSLRPTVAAPGLIEGMLAEAVHR